MKHRHSAALLLTAGLFTAGVVAPADAIPGGSATERCTGFHARGVGVDLGMGNTTATLYRGHREVATSVGTLVLGPVDPDTLVATFTGTIVLTNDDGTLTAPVEGTFDTGSGRLRRGLDRRDRHGRVRRHDGPAAVPRHRGNRPDLHRARVRQALRAQGQEGQEGPLAGFRRRPAGSQVGHRSGRECQGRERNTAAAAGPVPEHAPAASDRLRARHDHGPLPGPHRRSPARDAFAASVVAASLLVGAGAGVGGAAVWTTQHDADRTSASAPRSTSPVVDTPAAASGDGSVEQVAQAVLPSVVKIDVAGPQGQGSGSGHHLVLGRADPHQQPRRGAGG